MAHHWSKKWNVLKKGWMITAEAGIFHCHLPPFLLAFQTLRATRGNRQVGNCKPRLLSQNELFSGHDLTGWVTTLQRRIPFVPEQGLTVIGYDLQWEKDRTKQKTS